ncbi:hypothetical protein [Methylobacterium ajmalii]|uniref:hypothetical protein n=1 Tax=Methylobacterium ajmalii TaxID=2738439 RepID=UPI002F325662
MALPKVRQEASRDPSRAALAEQIERRTAARQSRDDALRALNEVEGRHSAATLALVEAQDALAEARPMPEADVVAATLRGETVDIQAPIVEARARVEDARRERDQLAVARDSLRAALDRASDRLRWADQSVREARAAVMQEALPGLIDRAKVLRAELLGIGRVLNVLRSEHTGPSIGPGERALLSEADDVGRSTFFERSNEVPATAEQLAWEDAMRGLLDDPNCPLPRIGE